MTHFHEGHGSSFESQLIERERERERGGGERGGEGERGESARSYSLTKCY